MHRQVWTVLLLASVALAGCAGSDEEPEPTGPVTDPSQLEAGTGAIAGLLVDDAFRPIELTDDPQSEYQAAGFVLLQETGEQTQTTANGEFSFADLEPGQYTLRVTASGHEATPQRVTVTEGVFNEVSVVARRILSEGSVILTQEFSGFVPCATGGLVAFTIGCAYDASGDSYRPGPILDFTVYEDELLYMIIEARANQPGDMSLVFREDDVTGSGGAEYGRADTESFDEPYMKMILANTQAVPEPEEGQDPPEQEYTIHYWPNDFEAMESLVFYWGEEPLAEIPVPEVGTIPVQTGVRLALEFDYILTLFLGEPEQDLQTYCVLCPQG